MADLADSFAQFDVKTLQLALRVAAFKRRILRLQTVAQDYFPLITL